MVIVLAIAIIMRRYMHSVADFLAANRCAGRYLICSSLAELGAAVMSSVMVMESFSKTGFSLGLWSSFTGTIFFMFTLFGVVTYRFRETRCLTFHQFLEVRYSRGIRVFSSFINIFSGMFNFGLIPAVGGRFFVYFCGLPETMSLFGFVVPTYAVVMIVLMAVSLSLALTGGQISVMVTDCIEGLISGIFYLVVAFFIVFAISTTQMKEAFLSGPPGGSFINPFDIGQRPDFNGTFVILDFMMGLMIFRGTAWNQGFNAAAKTAHEGQMAGIISSWRWAAQGAMMTLVCIGAFTLLHHPDFIAQQKAVQQGLQNIPQTSLRGEMSMPMALGFLLIPGVKGVFCAIALFGVLSSQGMQLHGYGSTLLQDTILPLLKRPLSPKAHLLALRLTASGIAVFVCAFSLLYKPVDYLQMLVSLIGAIYLAGIGAVVWGGLYWKKGTTAGAWTSMSIGASMAISFNILQQFWTQLQPWLVKLAGSSSWAVYLAAHPDKCPFNGKQLSVFTAVCAFTGYIVVSLLTCKRSFNMDQMLHRGRYAIADESGPVEPLKEGFSWGKLIGIDEHFTKGDRIISWVTFGWSIGWQLISVGIVGWWFFIGPVSDTWWFYWMVITAIWIPLVIGVITTVWFSIGTTTDIIDLLKTLNLAKRNESDDGTVRDHHNLGEPSSVKENGPGR
jgi:SSS family solute:Na+ symporter